MLTLILFALGGSTGLVVAIATGQRTHLRRYNMVSVEILGAFFGGLGLPRILHNTLPFGVSPIVASLLCAALVTLALAAVIAFVCLRLVE